MPTNKKRIQIPISDQAYKELEKLAKKEVYHYLHSVMICWKKLLSFKKTFTSLELPIKPLKSLKKKSIFLTRMLGLR